MSDTNKAKYWLFAFELADHSGGIHDLVAVFHTLKEAKDEAEKHVRPENYTRLCLHIVRVEENDYTEILERYWTKNPFDSKISDTGWQQYE